MKHRPMLATGLLCSIVLGFSAARGTPAADDWPNRWQVNGNGEKGTLEFTIDDRGVLVGQLLHESVEGFVSGRHLVIRRDTGGRTELWEGWLSEAAAGPDIIVAGSITVDEAGETSVYPWFGIPDVGQDAEAPAAAPTAVSAPAVAGPARSDSDGPSDVPSPHTAPSAEPAGGPLSGTWVSLTGQRVDVVQDGKRLAVTLPDGSSHAGRVTGDSSLVVGLRKGCCSGTLESPDVIVWSDGARWQRAD